MAIYFTVDLDKLAARCLYLDQIGHTHGTRQVATHIVPFRTKVTPRTPHAFPTERREPQASAADTCTGKGVARPHSHP
jgi:hypothetical protein